MVCMISDFFIVVLVGYVCYNQKDTGFHSIKCSFCREANPKAEKYLKHVPERKEGASSFPEPLSLSNFLKL